MVRRSIRDEDGMVLVLALVMIVLIGVMGAGLLVFVSRDLETAVELNKGQRALDIADAGVAAAKTKLLAEANPSSYDADNTATPTYYAHACNTDGGWNALPIPRDGEVEGGGFWNPDFGVRRDFADGAFYVEMRYLSPDSSDRRCRSPLSTQTTPDAAKYPTRPSKTYPIPRIDAGYYRVTATGCYPGDVDGDGNCTDDRAAKRRVEAIFRTEELGAPLAIYTQNRSDESVVLNASACVRSVNVFTMGGVRLNGSGGCEDNLLTSASGAPNHLYDPGNNVLGAGTVTRFGGSYGGPFDYGDWRRSEYDNFAHLDGTAPLPATPLTPEYFNAENPFNTTARVVVSPGIGAVGPIRPAGAKVPGRDYDCTPTALGTGGCATGTGTYPRFTRKGTPTAPQTSGQISFPFDHASVEGQRDTDRMGLLRSEALRQEEYRYAGDIENYVEADGGSTVEFTATGSGAAYRWPQYPRIGQTSPIRPQTSNYTTVVYVRFTGSTPGTVRWGVDHGGGCGGHPERGILVVENGNVVVEGSRTPLHGMVIVRGTQDDDGDYPETLSTVPSVGNYTQEAGACTGGGVDATGRVSLSGETRNIIPNDSANLAHNTNFSAKEVDFPGVVGYHSVELWSWRESYE